MSASSPDWRIVVMALLYSIGAHGIMTLNDFKSVEGDKRMGIDSLPVLLGVERAARFACLVMAVPQAVVVVLLLLWQRPLYALAVGTLLIAQFFLMAHFLKSPRERAPWYNGTGISCYVLGMLISAFALAAIRAEAIPALTGRVGERGSRSTSFLAAREPACLDVTCRWPLETDTAA